MVRVTVYVLLLPYFGFDTVMPSPKLNEVAPLKKPPPAMVAVTDVPTLALAGVIFVIPGTGYLTVKVADPDEPPPGVALLTVILRFPAVLAFISAVLWTVMDVQEFTVVVTIVRPVPSFGVVTP